MVLASQLEIVMVPVVKITRQFMCGRPIVFLAAMMDCVNEQSAIAAFPKEPSDKVEFAWWGIPREPMYLPTLGSPLHEQLWP
jgi:hypothetical protein